MSRATRAQADPKKVETNTGHFVKGSVAAFDAPFFSITPEEAAPMDPQQQAML